VLLVAQRHKLIKLVEIFSRKSLMKIKDYLWYPTIKSFDKKKAGGLGLRKM